MPVVPKIKLLTVPGNNNKKISITRRSLAVFLQMEIDSKEFGPGIVYGYNDSTRYIMITYGNDRYRDFGSKVPTEFYLIHEDVLTKEYRLVRSKI